ATVPTRQLSPRAPGSTAPPPPIVRCARCDRSTAAADELQVSGSPPRLLAEDPEHGLAHQLVGEGVVAGVEPSAADVAVEALELVAGEHAAATDRVEGDVDHPLRGLD